MIKDRAGPSADFLFFHFALNNVPFVSTEQSAGTGPPVSDETAFIFFSSFFLFVILT